MKAILMSVQPKWLEKILNGEKTIEIRKTMPKCDLPIKVYLYCTKRSNLFKADYDWGRSYDEDISGKVVAKFTLREVDTITNGKFGFRVGDSKLKVFNLIKWADLDCETLEDYAKDKDIFAWHISDLVVFDKPMELGEFRAVVHCRKCPARGWYRDYENCSQCLESHKLTRPPQSWQYVEYNELKKERC